MCSDLESVPEASQAFHEDILSIADSPWGRVCRWHLLSPSLWLNVTPEGRDLESAGYLFFSWKKSDCEEGKTRPECAG